MSNGILTEGSPFWLIRAHWMSQHADFDKRRERSNRAGLKPTSRQFVDKALQSKDLLVSNNLPELEKGRASNHRFRPK